MCWPWQHPQHGCRAVDQPELRGGFGGVNHLVGKFTATQVNDLDIVTTDKPPVGLSQRGSVIITDEQIPGVTTKIDAPGITIGLRGRTSPTIVHAPLRADPERPRPADSRGAGQTPRGPPLRFRQVGTPRR